MIRFSCFNFPVSFLSSFSLFLLSFRLFFSFLFLQMTNLSVPASLASGVNVIPDQTMISNDALHAHNAPLANELAESTVTVQSVELSHDRYEEVCMSVERIVDPTLPLRDM